MRAFLALSELRLFRLRFRRHYRRRLFWGGWRDEQQALKFPYRAAEYVAVHEPADARHEHLIGVLPESPAVGGQPRVTHLVVREPERVVIEMALEILDVEIVVRVQNRPDTVAAAHEP